MPERPVQIVPCFPLLSEFPAGKKSLAQLVPFGHAAPHSRFLHHQVRDPIVHTAKTFCDLYRSNHQEFPPECREADYERKLKAAYPIHPEIFERLYQDWSGLVKFQTWDGSEWKIVSDWIAPDKAMIRQMIEESAAKYAKEKNITPRDCGKEG